MQQSNIERRDFLKWSGIAGSAALLAPSLLTACAPTKTEPLSETGDETVVEDADYITDAISEGLPYGADKVCPVLCTNGDACGQLHTGQCYVKDGVIVHYEGCTAGHNKGGMCARGMSGLDIINHPDRIKYPMRRTNEKGVEGTFERISWEEAIDEITTAMAAAIQEEGSQTVGTGWAHASNYPVYPVTSYFNATFGTDNALIPDCWFDLQFGPVPTLGDMYHCHEEDPMSSKLLILWGENTSVSKPQEWSSSYGRAKYEGGATLVVVDARMTETALKADIYLPVRPGTDAYLAMAMANVIIEEGLVDEEFIKDHTYGYEDFAKAAKKYTPEEVEKITWTPADKIREVARLYATTKPAMIAIGRGGNSAGGKNSNAGWLMSRTICCLPGLCGHFGEVGSGISIETSSGSPANLNYHWPAPALFGAMAGRATPQVQRTAPPSAGIWGQKGVLYDRKPYGYRVLIHHGNPASSSGNQALADKAFKQIDMLVIHNRLIHRTASLYANILLPICTGAEMYAYRVDWEGMVVTEPAIDPLFESKSDLEMYRLIALALRDKLGLEATDEEIWPWKDDKDAIGSCLTSDLIKNSAAAAVEAGKSEYEIYATADMDTYTAHPETLPNPFYAGHEGFVPYKAKYYMMDGSVPEGTDPEAIWFPTDGGNGRLLFKADFLPEVSGGVLPALPIPEEPEDSYYAKGNPIESGNWDPAKAVGEGFEYITVGRGHKPWQFLSFNQNPDGGPASQLLREAFEAASEPIVNVNPADATKLGVADGDYVTIESQYGAMEHIKVELSETIMPGTIFPPYHWGNVQNQISPCSRSFEAVAPELRPQLTPPFVGMLAGETRRSTGGINNQTGTLCKIYKA